MNLFCFELNGIYFKPSFSLFSVGIISTVTQGDAGGPLVVTLKEKDGYKKYIYGIMVHPVGSINEQFLRFTRITFVLPHIRKKTEDLHFPGEDDIDSANSSREDFLENSHKRPKF